MKRINKKIRRVLFGLIISVLLVGTSAAVSTIAANKAKVTVDKKGVLYKALTEEGFFDPEYYAACNEDVVRIIGGDYDSLIYHFTTYGIFEGRQPNPNFNVNAYSSAYKDLRDAFISEGKSKEQLILDYYNHYVTYGKNEERIYASITEYLNAGGIVVPVGSAKEVYIEKQPTPTASEPYYGGQASSGENSGSSSSGSNSGSSNGNGSSNANVNNTPSYALNNSQYIAVDIKEGLASSCPHNSTKRELVTSQAGINNNGYVNIMCDLCNNKVAGYNVHAYKIYQYYDAGMVNTDVAGWLASDYDNTSNTELQGVGKILLYNINSYRTQNGKAGLTWASNFLSVTNQRAIEASAVDLAGGDQDKKPNGDDWYTGATELQKEIVFCQLNDTTSVWNNIMADPEKLAVISSSDYTSVSIGCFHRFDFANGSHIPTEKVYWVIDFK